jgi:hypothetical protein
VAGHAGLVTASLAMDDLIASSGASYRAVTMPFIDNLLRQVESIKTGACTSRRSLGTASWRPAPPGHRRRGGSEAAAGGWFV